MAAGPRLIADRRAGKPLHGNAVGDGMGARVVVRRLGLREQWRDKRRLLWLSGLAAIAAAGMLLVPDKDLARSVLFGALVGMLAHWRSTCSATVEIPADSASAAMIAGWLKARGYREPSAGVLKPRFPDWACFASQTITLQERAGVTRVTGPWFILRKLVALRAGTGTRRGLR